MATIKQIEEIFRKTPIEQAIMIEGYHGIGKSEIIKNYFEKQGYRVVIKFLSQMSDAGDLAGLPDKTIVNKKINGENVEVKVTTNCLPIWWPVDDDEKTVLFLDEFNRAKAEVLQAAQDITLNRQYMGTKLPKNTRIIAGVNGSHGGYYDVNDIDPSLLDRFNYYVLTPTVDEWLEWAKNNKVNKHIRMFISKNPSYLDSPAVDSNNAVDSSKVYQSRRSWKRASDYMNTNPDDSIEELTTYLLGVVGISATTMFATYMKEFGKSINVKSLMLDHKTEKSWRKEFETIISDYDVQQCEHLNRQICDFLATNFNDWNVEGIKQIVSQSLEYYFSIIHMENIASMLEMVIQNNDEKNWITELLKCNDNLIKRFVYVKSGIEQEIKQM